MLAPFQLLTSHSMGVLEVFKNKSLKILLSLAILAPRTKTISFWYCFIFYDFSSHLEAATLFGFQCSPKMQMYPEAAM